MYKLIKRDGLAKRGEFHTAHGVIQTPVFMNVGTIAAIKGAVSTEDLQGIKTQVQLSNTYHLHVRPGDEIVKMGEKDVHFYKEIRIYSAMHVGEPVEVTYKRGGQEYTTLLTPKYDEESGRYLYGFISTSERVRTGLFDTIRYSFYDVAYYIDVTIQSVKMLFSGGVTVNDLNGPVGIVQNMGAVYEESVATDGYYYAFLNMLSWTIMLSANLGVMNLLPIPALDGGRLVFLLIEAIRGKAIDPNKEGFVHMIGIILLFGLMFVVMFNDIRKIFI